MKSGAKALERYCAWAVPGEFTAPEKNNDMHCYLDGSNCQSQESSLPKPTLKSEVFSRQQSEARGIVWRGNSSEEPSHHHLAVPKEGYPEEFSWCNKDGVNYCTTSLNQHIPQYCGSCWAHGAVSALQDRIKIQRDGQGIDIALSVQHVLNCANVGSCHGGSDEGVYQWIKQIGDATGSGIAYLSGQPYMACSSDSTVGFCPQADWSCTALNTARTCGTFGEECVGLSHYPNATISEFGSITGVDAIQREVFNRGPVACGVDSTPLHNYTTGVATEGGNWVNHIISVVGWGTDATEGQYWIIRNSWGEYWGEHGYARVQFGALQLNTCAWAVPKDFTAPEKHNQFPCVEDGSNCKSALEMIA